MRVAIIPARGGSRRIPRKNIRGFHGKPIIAYSIEAAKASGLFDQIFISTDDPEAINIARDYECFIHLRSTAYLSGSEAGTQEVVEDCLLNSVNADYACCIYATAPMLRPSDLVNGHDLLRVIDDYAYVPGWFYWGRAEWFGVRPLKEPAPLVVEVGRYIDINTEEDWKRAEEMYAALTAFEKSQ